MEIGKFTLSLIAGALIAIAVSSAVSSYYQYETSKKIATFLDNNQINSITITR